MIEIHCSVIKRPFNRLIANAFLLVYVYVNLSLFSRSCLLHFVYFPTQDEFYVVFFMCIFVFSLRIYFILASPNAFFSLRPKICFVMQGVSRHAFLYRFENPTNSLHPHLITINTYAEDLVICSLNVWGLSNTMEKRETFRRLKLKSYAIYFLQEVHCTKEKEILWTSE